MAWIKSEQALATHPKLLLLSKDIGVSVPQTVGHLHLLWWWALDYCQDGVLTKYREFIPLAAQWEGEKELFIESLIKHGWLDLINLSEGSDEEDLVIHDWMDYTGNLIIVREKDRERKRKARTSKNSKNSNNKDDWEVSESPNKSTKPVQRTSVGHPEDVQTPSAVRGEERRGDESRGEEMILASNEAEIIEPTSIRTVFSALCNAFGYNSSDLTQSSRGMLNKVAKELSEVGATSWDIEQRMKNYALTYGKKPTPTALAKHWTDMIQANPQIDIKTLSKLQSTAISKNNLQKWAEN